MRKLDSVIYSLGNSKCHFLIAHLQIIITTYSHYWSFQNINCTFLKTFVIFIGEIVRFDKVHSSGRLFVIIITVFYYNCFLIYKFFSMKSKHGTETPPP